ncbi:hypothetical protein [Pseudomonas proteolytica]|uniref:hypothetical protein n=1 Tax=Pseudomonas proteolytica TaxID=219574 RepID=UPI001475C5C7|nr:hypothetical protein [Pseudomonas proteolytica]NMY98452.1 hypothetical protein [Pseudomonas proteolytica]
MANDPVVLPQASIIDAWNSDGLPEVLSGMFVSSGVCLAFLIAKGGMWPERDSRPIKSRRIELRAEGLLKGHEQQVDSHLKDYQ